MITTHALNDLRAPHYPAGRTHQQFQEFILACKQLDLPPRAYELARQQVEYEIRHTQHGLPLGRPAREGTHPRAEFTHVERFGEILIRPGVEPFDPLRGFAACGDKESRS